ncbi:dihydropteroate synthase [Novosphingobium cyanobacteriorum]|uniref:dihydropteroate synthase n=1 Tax=Novosphingobium cyanobacteriorum TaxID=3024215 RepID=A0ABT6CPN0_9SPHN|nr:dihydropteroate synthase [Novosphingobium cyanobacteriorum]MDF8335055.1 dihydropteroate synthase [Novosphingobium cyanobacteriorum]
MTQQLYIRPIALAESPQSEEGEAIRLAGGLVYASRFALIVREGGRVISRRRASVSNMAEALACLPGNLHAEGEAQWADLRRAHPPLQAGSRTLRLDQPQVMGILNVTPDSFSDGGKFLDKPDEALAHAHAMLEAGAAIIDVGGESTRPNAPAVWEGDELKRVVPVIERLAASGAAISIDSRRSSVIEAALAAGAHIVNDVSGLRHDPRSMEIVAASGAPVVLMHAPGDASDLHADGDYADVVLDVFDALRERRDAAIAGGIAREKILLDPGIGFGKSLAENLALINALPLLHALGQPILFGASRKRMIGALSNEAPAHQRLGGSLAVALRAFDTGCHVVRVHDVPETVQALHVWRGLRDAALTDFSQLGD